MEVGKIGVWLPPAEAVLYQQAGDLFNALGESPAGAFEYGAEVTVRPLPDTDALVGLGLRFYVGNQLADPMGWSECRLVLESAKHYLEQRPAGGIRRENS